ncbi:L-threonylcarbamoyladenylate synthase [Proteinivorax hydrogeniformans]|uniref:Threonylcarbamoyl-AMP synthase n=1 Tax=Proteinivorax hydrogeniformans TaxID=1826727 RepID=A0AAU8HSU0_9FIRM
MENKVRTRILHETDEDFITAAKALNEGKTVVFPTETVYGLGANALDDKAISKVFKAKGRPSDNPLILHIPSVKWLEKLAVKIPPEAFLLGERFWPGPLTLVLLADKTKVPSAVRGGLDTVAVRIPAHPVAKNLIQKANIPVAAPSANRSGRPSPTSFNHALEDLNGRVDYIINGGDAKMGLESTVLDLTASKPVILRPGLITKSQINLVVKAQGHKEYAGGKVLSPGTKYKHYSPQAPMVVFVGDQNDVIKKIKERAQAEKKAGKKVGVLSFEQHLKHFNDVDELISMGSQNSPLEVAGKLYGNLNTIDKAGVEIILAMGLDLDDELSYAVMNRLLKACGNNVVKS